MRCLVVSLVDGRVDLIFKLGGVHLKENGSSVMGDYLLFTPKKAILLKLTYETAVEIVDKLCERIQRAVCIITEVGSTF